MDFGGKSASMNLFMRTADADLLCRSADAEKGSLALATHFFWDPVEDNIVQERDDSGVITAEYATEPYLYGNVISQNRGGVESQYHFDSQGSTLALTDDNQQITDSYGYSAFGEEAAQIGTSSTPF
jgi:hypothetical protein